MPDSSKNRELFSKMLIGTLLYAVVIGFFNDYTDFISTKSYSTTFLVSIVMQVLTYITFNLKGRVFRHFKLKENKLLMVLGVWSIMFSSKFVFLAVLDKIFGSNFNISGFVGLILIIATFTISQKLIEYTESKL
jgi:uncharacterized membrane protein YczE